MAQFDSNFPQLLLLDLGAIRLKDLLPKMVNSLLLNLIDESWVVVGEELLVQVADILRNQLIAMVNLVHLPDFLGEVVVKLLVTVPLVESLHFKDLHHLNQLFYLLV